LCTFTLVVHVVSLNVFDAVVLCTRFAVVCIVVLHLLVPLLVHFVKGCACYHFQ
jgi:hypothetical protein